MNATIRRRFLIDSLCAGGMLCFVARLSVAGAAPKKGTASPAATHSTACPTPPKYASESATPKMKTQHVFRGEAVAVPPKNP